MRGHSLLLLVAPSLLAAQAPEVVTRSGAGCTHGVDFRAIVTPETVYVGQQATYQLGVFIDQETRSRLRRNPEFVPPESRSMLSYDLPDRGSVFNGTIGGQQCEAHIFRRALFPLTPGRYAIPSARLNYALPQNPSFFSREEAYSLRSEAVAFVAIDAPVAGRPTDWAGAVGSWHASARIDTARGRAGDPLVLTLRVEGQGNVTLLPRPSLAIGWASVVAADERVRLDSTPTALRGSKEFDWLVTPVAGGQQRVPPIRFVYFNPFSRRYETAVTEPFSVRVAPGTVVAADAIAEVPPNALPLSIRAALGDERPPPLGSLAWFRLVLLLAPAPALLAWRVRRPRRVPRAVTPQERLRAARRSADATAASVRRALLDGLHQRNGLEAAGLAQPGAWTTALRLEGASDETARAVEALLDDLDRSAFGGDTDAPAALAERAAALLERVDREARPRFGRRGARERQRQPLAPALLAFAVALGTAGTVYAADQARARSAFAEGATAYAGADYVRAARLFEDAAREAPRAAAAWANAGTAAWAAHDTALAIVGWQRALRLEPMAPELRSRLAQTRAPQDVGLARVPALPARLPSALLLLLWLAGWSLAARQLWHRRSPVPLIVTTLIVGVSLGAYARWVELRLEGWHLAVVTEPAGLRAVPALGAESGVVPISGEVARVVQRLGVWTRISLDGGRDGWIATERLAVLGRD